jgi:hypothetical protein
MIRQQIPNPEPDELKCYRRLLSRELRFMLRTVNSYMRITTFLFKLNMSDLVAIQTPINKGCIIFRTLY